MKRRKPTDEQKQKAAERREKFKALAKAVSEMTDEQRQAIVERFGAVVTCEGWALSAFNSCLLISQDEKVSMVGGFQQWLRAGRSVIKGQHGLMLWIPRAAKADADAKPAADGEEDKTRFVMGYVFDVTQTQALEEQGAEQEQEVAACA